MPGEKGSLEDRQGSSHHKAQVQEVGSPEKPKRWTHLVTGPSVHKGPQWKKGRGKKQPETHKLRVQRHWGDLNG